MSQLRLEGEVDDRDEVIERLHADNRRLSEELRLAKLEVLKAKSDNESVLAGVQEIRSLLTPLYRGLRLTFGEIEALPLANNGGQAVATATANPKRAVWQRWIDDFGSDTLNAKMIIALLDHGSLSAEQLRVPMKCSAQSIYNTYGRLQKLGLVKTSSGKYFLKEL